MIVHPDLPFRGQPRPGAFGALAGLLYAAPIALALWAVIALFAIAVF